MKITVTLSGEQVKNALLYYINDNEKFDIADFEENPELVLTLDSSDKFDTTGEDTISIEFEKKVDPALTSDTSEEDDDDDDDQSLEN